MIEMTMRCIFLERFKAIRQINPALIPYTKVIEN